MPRDARDAKNIPSSNTRSESSRINGRTYRAQIQSCIKRLKDTTLDNEVSNGMDRRPSRRYPRGLKGRKEGQLHLKYHDCRRGQGKGQATIQNTGVGIAGRKGLKISELPTSH